MSGRGKKIEMKITSHAKVEAEIALGGLIRLQLKVVLLKHVIILLFLKQKTYILNTFEACNIF